MKQFMLLILCFPLMFGAVPSDSAPVDLTAAEEAALGGGEIVIRNVPSDSGGFVVGVVDIQASPEKVWESILDFQARVADVRSLTKVESYDRSTDPERLGVKWVLSVLGQEIVFHIKYEVDRASGWCRYALDTTKENDIVSSEGSYQVYSVGSSTRFVYRSQSDSGRRMPGWLRRWFAVDSLKDQITGIRRRAQQSP